MSSSLGLSIAGSLDEVTPKSTPQKTVSLKSGRITEDNELRTLATDTSNGVKGMVMTNQGSISELERELRMIKTRMTSSDSRQIIG